MLECDLQNAAECDLIKCQNACTNYRCFPETCLDVNKNKNDHQISGIHHNTASIVHARSTPTRSIDARWFVLLILWRRKNSDFNDFFYLSSKPRDTVSPSERQFRVVYEWRTLDFAFRNEQERSAAIFRGEYVPRNVIFSAIKPYANRLYMVSR